MTKKPIAIVTGRAGFIGSHMVDLLIEDNFQVRVIDDLSGGHLDNLNQHKNNTNNLYSETVKITYACVMSRKATNRNS